LFVEAIELEAVWWRGASGTGAGNAFHGVEGMHEYSVCSNNFFVSRDKSKGRRSGAHLPTESDISIATLAMTSEGGSGWIS